jgi:ParB/RepB/Spo0J family partition protein
MSTIKTVSFAEIAVPDELNARTSLDGIEELAKNIAIHGLLQPLIVVNGGPADKPYRLVAGFRRAHALKLLKWGKKDIPVNVIDGDEALVNLVENVQRDELHPADLAQRLHDLSTGEYEVPAGATAAVYDKKFLSEQTGLTVSHINNLIRAHVNLCVTVKKAWKKMSVPMRLIFQLSAMEEPEQEKVFASWKEAQDLLDSVGKKRKPKSEGEEGEGGEGEGGEDNGATASAKKVGKKDIAEKIVALGEAIEEAKGTHAEKLKTQRDTLRWVLGELSRFPSAK